MVIPKRTREPGELFRGAVRGLVRLCVVAMICAPWFNIPRDNADSAGMLAHLHAFTVDFDLLYDNEYRALRVTPTFAFVTSQGVVSNHWPSGATWLQLPGYAVGGGAVALLDSVGLRHGGLLGPLPVLAVRGLAMLVLLAMTRVVVRICAHGTRRAAWVTAFAWVGGTPLLYYASEAPLRPHVWGCAVMLVFVWAWRNKQWGTPRARAVVLGALVGLAATIRPQLAPAWLLVAEDVRRRRGPISAWVAGAGTAALWPLLHLRVQAWMYGSSLVDYSGELTHHLRAFAVSPHHGALVWTPLLAVGALALVRAAVRKERASWLILAIVAHQVWLNAGMRDITPFSVLGSRTWAGGAGFGARKLVDALPLLLPSVASLAGSARTCGRARALGVTAVALTVPSLLLHAAAFLSPSVTSAVLDWAGLARTWLLPFEPDAWRQAWQQRALAHEARVVLTGVGALGFGLLVSVWARRTRGWPRVGIMVLGAAVLAHVWVTVLMVRADQALIEDPTRMARARAHMHPRHVRAVAAIPRYHAYLRRVLGDHVAPTRAAREAAHVRPPARGGVP